MRRSSKYLVLNLAPYIQGGGNEEGHTARATVGIPRWPLPLGLRMQLVSQIAQHIARLHDFQKPSGTCVLGVSSA